MDAGIVPFTLGADVHGYTIHRPDDGAWDGGYFDEHVVRRREPSRHIGGAAVFSLIQVMNELLALGLRLTDVIRMVTVNAATMLGLEGQIGTLALGVQFTANERLRPEFALKDGRLHLSDSPLVFESTKGVA